MASDRAVAQYRLGQCGLHLACAGCSADPYCSWNIARSECFSRDSVHATAVGWISGASSAHRCRSYVRSVSRRLFPGDGALLECPLPEADWKVDNVPVAEDSAHLVLARAGGLVLLNVTRAQSGTYQCVHEGMPAVEYMVLVDDGECSAPGPDPPRCSRLLQAQVRRPVPFGPARVVQEARVLQVQRQQVAEVVRRERECGRSGPRD